MLHKITKFVNPFMVVRTFDITSVWRDTANLMLIDLVKALAAAQICLMIAYGVLTYHDVSTQYSGSYFFFIGWMPNQLITCFQGYGNQQVRCNRTWNSSGCKILLTVFLRYP